jgi:peptidoglycan/LPS O-acetylase OafA/YrhL
MSRGNDETLNNFTLLRLVLALMVVLGHFKLLSGTAYPKFPFNLADAAVDSFFVVSGFLIAGSYERCRGLWSFYVRRCFRLYPMYVCVVLLQTVLMLALLPGGPFSEPRATLDYLAANLVLANFLQYDIGGVLAGLNNPGINPSLWTLKIEIGFYLIAPLIFGATRRWGWPALAATFAGSVAFSIVALWLGDVRIGRQLPGQLQFFAVGMGLYLYGDRLKVSPWASAVVAAGFLALWTLVEPIPPGIRPLVVAAFVLTFALCTPVVRMKSDMSYSVYLLHGPLIQTLILIKLFQDTRLFLAGIVCVVLGLSYVAERLVERPGNALGYRLARRFGQRTRVVPHLA